jgi:3-methyl-2-oxobutanoate hydroxymethyltransferase
LSRIKIHEIRSAKGRKPLAMLTAYDFATASALNEAGIEIILAGDSYAMVSLGYPTTLPVTMEEMLTITKAVSRASGHSMVIADMPYMSYQADMKTAKLNASRFLKEADADGVKLECIPATLDTVKALVDAEIPVMAHVGLTPQSVKRMGGFRIQGRSVNAGRQFLKLAEDLDKAGVFAIVLEGIPEELAAMITASVSVPTIGIGAGGKCDGQVLVINDLIGLNPGKLPHHAKAYADVRSIILRSAARFKNDVGHGKFPAKKNSVHLDRETLKELTAGFKDKHESHNPTGKDPKNFAGIL